MYDAVKTQKSLKKNIIIVYKCSIADDANTCGIINANHISRHSVLYIAETHSQAVKFVEDYYCKEPVNSSIDYVTNYIIIDTFKKETDEPLTGISLLYKRIDLSRGIIAGYEQHSNRSIITMLF